MLGLSSRAKKQNISLEEKVQLVQQGDVNLLNELIGSYRPFIAKTVSSVCKKYINESDDEFSIGLIAFHEAIEKYNADKGSSLISFSEILIKRRVIDYIRRQSKYETLSLDIGKQNGEDEYEGSAVEVQLSIDAYQNKKEEEMRKEEIVQFTEMLRQFNLTFTDLLEQSPKHMDARKNAMMAAKILVEDSELRNHFLTKNKLPIKQLEKKVSISRKTLERNRKYIMAMSLILIGDFHYIKDYIKGVLQT